MRAGYGSVDITPRSPLTLSGFVSRCNIPFEKVDDQLQVKAMAIESENQTLLLLAYDLLALGPELHSQITRAIAGVTTARQRPVSCILCSTHTHSAPATIILLGCGEPDQAYWDQVVAASLASAEQALQNLAPCRLRHRILPLVDVAYNRRRMPADGCAVKSQMTELPATSRGQTWDDCLLARFEDENGKGIAGLVCWAAHGVTVIGKNVTADYPGEVCRRLERQHGFPFLFLQGACGDVNPVFMGETGAQMTAYVDSIMTQAGNVSWPEPARDVPFRIRQRAIPLAYAPRPKPETLRNLRDSMAKIAATGRGPRDELNILAGIMNIEPEELPAQNNKIRYIASVLRAWCANCLESLPAGLPESRELAMSIWQCGNLGLCFAAAEIFAETALKLRSKFPNLSLHLVGYAGPLVGYLPTDAALVEGGYETEYAYRFYNHPAPFARGSESMVINTFKEMIDGN